MIVTLVHVWVKEAYRDAFVTEIIENQKHTLQEPGNLRFDILQDADNPLKFVIYEVFKDDQAIADHKATAHYLKWRDTVAGWMEKPRKGEKYVAVSPLDESAW